VARWSYATAKALDEHPPRTQRGFAGHDRAVLQLYGPRLDPRGYGSVVARFLGQALVGEPLTVHGDGSQTRCFTYVADSVRGTLLAARSPDSLGRVFNIGSDVETTLNNLARTIIDVTGSSSTIEHGATRRSSGRGSGTPAQTAPGHHQSTLRARVGFQR
jgi:UDP-glucose 4-epimerase